MSVPTLTITPGSAASAYARVASGDSVSGVGEQFGAALSKALDGVVQAGRGADEASLRAIAGKGNVTEAVTAVSRAELALQSAVAVRDKVVQAYQDIMRMPI